MPVDYNSLRPYAETDQQKAYLEAVIEHGGLRAAQRALGHSSNGTIGNALGRIKARAARQGWAPEHDWRNSVPEGYAMKGTSTLYGAEGELKQQWVKTDKDALRQFELAKEALLGMADELPRLPPTPPRKNAYNTDLMTVIPIADAHIGMYSHHEETGEDYDTTIACSDTCAAVDYLVQRGPASSHCLIVNLGDLLHADNLKGMTEKSGNVLDMDTRMSLVMRKALAAVRQCISSALEKHDTVEYMHIGGNHDEILAHAFRIAFAAIYENEPRVTIHDSPRTRQYKQFGSVLIGCVHGHQTKDTQLPGIMAAEQSKAWGDTRHRYFFRGHHHHDDRKEYPGCIVEQFRNLAAADAYAAEHGFLSGRDMKSIVMHKDFGEVSRITCAVDMLRRDVA